MTRLLTLAGDLIDVAVYSWAIVALSSSMTKSLNRAFHRKEQAIDQNQQDGNAHRPMLLGPTFKEPIECPTAPRNDPCN
jgi:hypothetical protein